MTDDTLTRAWSKGFAAGSKRPRKCPVIGSGASLCGRTAEYQITGTVVCGKHARLWVTHGRPMVGESMELDTARRLEESRD